MLRTHARPRRGRRALGAVVAIAIGATMLQATSAVAEEEAAATALPSIVETVSPEGFRHPGIGVTADQLANVQEQLAAGAEPWASYGAAMSQTSYASRTYVAQNQGVTDEAPKDASYNEVAMRSRAHADSLGALTQAIMYATTGDEIYRANALHVLRTWSSLDPAQYAYFSDAHIHTGVPLYYFVTAAEIIRSTEPVNDELDGYSLVWSENDQQRAEDNLVRPTIDTFLYSQNRLWNQHTYGVLGMLAGAIFLDDAALYAERVEWFSVNSTYESQHTINGGDVNGGLSSLIRVIEADDPLNPYGAEFVELVEMGRDQAHAEGDITTLSAAARIIHNQGTRLDPVAGTVSTADDAVSPYGFLGNRLLHGADAFAQFMMGGEPPFIDTSGGAGAISQAYRGRLRDLMSDLYYQYTYVEGVDVEAEAPYLARLHAQSDGPLYFYGGAIENFWNPRGSDFTDSEYWLAFPEALAADDVQVPAPAASAAVSPVKYGFAAGDGATLGADGDDIARLDPAAGDAVIAIRRMVFASTTSTSLVGIPVRTNGASTLQASATARTEPFAEIALPDTGGEWATVWVDLRTAYLEGRATGQHILYLRALDGAAVDVGPVLADATKTLGPPVFDDAPSLSFIAVAGEQISRRLPVADADSEFTLALQGAPDGADIAADGTFTWTPAAEGGEQVLVVASDGESTSTLPIAITVVDERSSAIKASLKGLSAPDAYTTESWAAVADARDAAHADLDADTVAFAQRIEGLRLAVADLDLLNPMLDDGTLDFSLTATSPELSAQTLMAVSDGSNQTTWGDRKDTTVELDFGAAYRVQADRFGFLARDTFPNRAEGTNVYGSNDGVVWTLLTERPNAGDDVAIEYLDVIDDVQQERFRFIRLQIDEPGDPTDPAFPGIWTIADLRIDGARSEATLDEVVAAAEGSDLSAYSRASTLLFEREIAAVAAEAGSRGADEKALVQRAFAAWDLLEEPTIETADIAREWVTASSVSWDGKLDAAANGWAMFDGDGATYTDTKTAAGWVSVIPADGSSLSIVGVRYVPRSTHVSRANGVEFQSSSDGGATWTTFATAAGAVAGWNSIELAAPVAANALRVSAASGNTNIAEVAFVTSTLDRSALSLLIEEAAQLVGSDWTADSWSALAEARADAEAALADTALDQPGVDAIADALEAAMAGLVDEGPAVAVSTTSACVRGKVVLTVSTINSSGGAVSLAVSTAYGDKTVSGLADGATSTLVFPSRRAAIGAGSASVVATGADGESTSTEAPYAARGCR